VLTMGEEGDGLEDLGLGAADLGLNL